MPKGQTSIFSVGLALTDDDGANGTGGDRGVHTQQSAADTERASFVSATINENVVATLTATLSDPSPLDTFSLVVNWADGSAPQTFSNLPSGSFTATHRYLDNTPAGAASTASVRLTLTDDDGASAPVATVAIVVHDLPPKINSPGFVLATINENDVATLTATLSDPSPLDTFSLVVNWADGSAPQTFNNLPSVFFAATHRYLDNVPRGAVSNASLSAWTRRDNDGITAPVATANLMRNTCAPIGHGRGVSSATVGSPFTLTGSFTDPGTLDTFTFLWHLVTDSNGQAVGDATTQTLTFAPTNTGAYTFTFRVTDDDGGVGVSTAVVIATAGIPSTAKFDFDAATGPATTAAGYTSVLGSTLYSVGSGYGWVTTAAASFDRGGTNLLLRDGNYGSAGTAGARTFQDNIANGSYLVNITMGDAGYARDSMQVKNADSGAILLSNINTGVNQFYQADIPVTVSDGSLDLQFSDQGGDPYWVGKFIGYSTRHQPRPGEFHFRSRRGLRRRSLD